MVQDMAIIIEGLDNVTVMMAKISMRIGRAKGKGLIKAGHYVAGKSINLAPLDEGDLRRSQFVDESQALGGVVTVGYNTEYALRQHEDLDIKHTEPGTQAKYLQQPFEESTGKIKKVVADEIKRAIEGG